MDKTFGSGVVTDFVSFRQLQLKSTGVLYMAKAGCCLLGPPDLVQMRPVWIREDVDISSVIFWSETTFKFVSKLIVKL